jgi:hypothetical protein
MTHPVIVLYDRSAHVWPAPTAVVLTSTSTCQLEVEFGVGTGAGLTPSQPAQALIDDELQFTKWVAALGVVSQLSGIPLRPLPQ